MGIRKLIIKKLMSNYPLLLSVNRIVLAPCASPSHVISNSMRAPACKFEQVTCGGIFGRHVINGPIVYVAVLQLVGRKVNLPAVVAVVVAAAAAPPTNRGKQNLIKEIGKRGRLDTISPAMAFQFQAIAFAGNPLRLAKLVKSPDSALETLKSLLLKGSVEESMPEVKILALKKGRPLAQSLDPVGDSPPVWRLGWISPPQVKEVPVDSFVYLGSGGGDDETFWAVDITDDAASRLGSGNDGFYFVELRTLMVATDWADTSAMGELSIAGQARALLDWHRTSRFCGYCGSLTTPIDSGRRKQCSDESCKKKIYPRVDPVVIMLVIDKENDRALLSRQSRFVPRMWSCLAGFIEPGESLEEAVRRETWEETGIEVGQVVYHSSQPWPVGPSSMPCQLMVGFFAYAKSLEIRVDKAELEDAQWHDRDEVKRALTVTDYEKAQKMAAIKVNQICKGVEKGQSLSSDFKVESDKFSPMFIPGPFAIAHHLISSWVNGESAPGGPGVEESQLSSVSNL